MLLDNKTNLGNNQHFKVFDFLKANVSNGIMNIVTGYFTIYALSKIYDNLNTPELFKMILGDLVTKREKENKIIDLLRDNLDIDRILELNLNSKKAVEFLEQDKVEIKHISESFCHAKAFVYDDPDRRHKFYIIGSSNLTESGLGICDSSNIELNTAITGGDSDYKDVLNWFNNLWTNAASFEIKLPDQKKLKIKQYIIDKIKSLFIEYTPETLYYKVLYELFKKDFENGLLSPNCQSEINYVKDTLLFKTLFPYQQKAVISLIKMLQDRNGAILADAVGLGKTWTALAVMKYFEIRGYKVVVFCPKKLAQNWQQYLYGNKSKFEKDRLDYLVRFHTDLQENRLDNYERKLSALQKNPKILIVIDESHNLRNDKSSRYEYLVENILKQNKDVKVLQLSATPINNKLIDVRNQFKLMVKGEDSGFTNTDLDIKSLERLFAKAQKDFKDWQEKDNRTINDFIAMLDNKFFALTDSLIVARTRPIIEKEFGNLKFPRKEKPKNIYISPENIGELKTFDDILNACKVNMTAYRPSEYLTDETPTSVLTDQKQREKFLCKMMYILLVKRLESSWYSFDITVSNILNYHKKALKKVIQFLENNEDIEIGPIDDIDLSNIEELEADHEVELGKKNPIKISSITQIELFKKHLEEDIRALEKLKNNLNNYSGKVKNDLGYDTKISELIKLIREKQKHSTNKKVVIFTTFADTAKYIFEKFKLAGFKKLAYVTGSESETDDGYKGAKFEVILERFAPFTKLFNEKDWSELYEEHNIEPIKDYQKWIEFINKNDKTTSAKLNNPIDILIATDCLSEGQNLQDADWVINYDIHWNPVRLIQRFGRIDRIGSPNDTIVGVNFWPTKNYEDYLKLKERVEKRMALMTLVGSEVNQELTPELEEMIKDNPLISKQAEKMLEQLQQTWEEVEQVSENIGLNDLSLEHFRQELFDLLLKNKDYFESIPNGVFTGFKSKPDIEFPELPEGIIAVLGYPKNKNGKSDFVYEEMHLLYSSVNGTDLFINNYEILTILRKHKLEKRFVPDSIENGNKEEIAKLSKLIKDWISNQIPRKAEEEISSIFNDGISNKIHKESQKLENKFKPENFDLITWFVVSN
ncbi:MAG: helicase-related protein [Ignavibacteria bacterium]|nr:helicase-related protein [Ignavibacteria bacterium]